MANNTDWLNISQMTGGTGETALSLTALTNTSLEPKTATITARNTQYNVSDTTTVTIQGFQPTLTLSRSTLRFDSTGGTATFTVYSNTAWTINFPAIVHSYSTSAGTGDTEVTVVLAPNPDEVAKVDTGIVKDVYNVNQLYLTIVQDSFITELTVTPDDDIIFTNTGSSTSLTIDTNTDWEIVYPAWVIPSVTSGSSGTTTVTFTAGENGPTDRSGEITVYAGSKSVTINVFQPFYIPPYITVTPSAWTFNYTEDGKTFIVDSYPEWTAEIIDTGETVWNSEVFVEATYVVLANSGASFPLYTQSGQSVQAVYIGPVRYFGTALTFDGPGTYKVRYTLSSGGTCPSFSGNTYLNEIHLSSGISSLAYLAFKGCSNLNKIISDSTTAPYNGGQGGYNEYRPFYGVSLNGTLIYPAGSDYSSWLKFEVGYLGYYNWNDTADDRLLLVATITYDVESLSTTKIQDDTLAYAVKNENGDITYWPGTGYTFPSTGSQKLDFLFLPPDSSATHYVNVQGISSITDIVMHQLSDNIPGVTGTQFSSLNANNCANLTGLTLNTDTSGTSAQIGLPTVKHYTVGGNATIVKGYDYFNSWALTDVVISPTNAIAIPNSTFRNATNLTSVTFGQTVSSIGQNCFSGCTSLPNITIPEGQADLKGTFYGCSSLSSITIPSSVKTIDSNAFYGCSSLTGITIPNTVTSLGSQPFRNCTSLSAVAIDMAVIPQSAFMGLNIINVQIGNNVTRIRPYAFYGCNALSSITVTATAAPSIDSNTFQNIKENGTLYYPVGSDYSSWLSSNNYYLGKYGWTGQEI